MIIIDILTENITQAFSPCQDLANALLAAKAKQQPVGDCLKRSDPSMLAMAEGFVEIEQGWLDA